MIFRFVLFLVLTTSAFAQPIANEVKLSGDGNRTRLTFDISNKVEMKAFALSDPYRIILDIDEVKFQFPKDTGVTGRGLVASWRYGLFAAGKSRVVVDLASPAKIDKAFVLDAVDNQPAKLVLDLVKTDHAGFIKAINDKGAALIQPAPKEKERIPTGSFTGDNRPVIVIDAGHGGIDTGALGANGTAEKSVVLNVARSLRHKLETLHNIRVVMTRDDDTFVPLGERTKIARENNAALFISLHADSLVESGDGARGATIYTLSETASDKDAARLAEKENKSDAIAGISLKDEPSVVSDILIELTQRETKAFSSGFAKSLGDHMKTATRMHKSPLRSAGFAVLRAHDVPSVLLELGYMSSQADLKLLTNEDWRERTSEQIAKAVVGFIKETKGR